VRTSRRTAASRPAVTRRYLRRWARWRHRLRDRPVANLAYRIAVVVVGLTVLVIGLAIPYPGPGWATLFVGLAMLATEFASARRLLVFTRKRYAIVTAWFVRKGLWVQAVGAAFATALVVATLWLFGVLGWVAALAGVEWPWLKSPI